MAKQNGIIRLRGTIDGVTYSQTRNGYVAYSKSGVDKARVQSDPKFKRTRENMREFGLLANAGKYLREAVKVISYAANDPDLTQRVLKLLTTIRNADLTNLRGKRTVAAALAANPALKDLLRGFEFNNRTHLRSVLLHPFSLDETTGTITLENFDVVNHVIFPAAATHVVITGGWARIRFENGSSHLELANPVVLAQDAAVQTLTLAPMAPYGSGTTLFLLRVGFLQEVNGVQYALNDEGFNALAVVGVA